MLALLHRFGLAVELALLALAVVLAAATVVAGVDTGPLALMIGALAALVAFVSKVTEPHDQSSDAGYVQRLVDEAAFAANYGEVASIEGPEWLLEDLRKHLKDPVLIPRRAARSALANAEAIYADFSLRDQRARERGESLPLSPIGGPEVVDRLNLPRKMLEPLFDLVPHPPRYLASIKTIPSDRRVPALVAGYNVAYQEGHDRRAWPYLLYLSELGDHTELENILAKRLITMENKGFSGPEYSATRDLAVRTTGIQFDDWYAKSVRPSLDDDATH